MTISQLSSVLLVSPSLSHDTRSTSPTTFAFMDSNQEMATKMASYQSAAILSWTTSIQVVDLLLEPPVKGAVAFREAVKYYFADFVRKGGGYPANP